MSNFKHTFEGRIFTLAETTNLDGTTHLRVFNAKGQLVSPRLAVNVRRSFRNK
jgi:hypothetical protein